MNCLCPKDPYTGEKEHVIVCRFWKPLWVRERERITRERGRVAEKELR